MISNLLNIRRRAVRLPTRLAIGTLVLVTMACGTKEAPGPLEPTQHQGRIRFVNLIVNPALNPVNAILENVPFGVNLGYTASTPSSLPAPNTAIYSAIYAGSRNIVLKKTADTSVTVANETFSVSPTTDNTLYAVGGAGGNPVAWRITIDDNSAVASGTTRLRFVNLRFATGDVDVFVTAPNADLSTATPDVHLPSSTWSSYITTVTPGTYQVRVVPSATAPANRSSNVVASISSLALASGAARTIVVADNANGGTPSTAFVLTDQ
jgi:hypothetical protein